MGARRHCAFLTLEDRADFFIYDHLLFDPLAVLGWTVEEIAWNRRDIDWGRFDAVVIRSTWDYQAAPDQFLATLENIEGQTRLYNPADICRWNLNKKYLRELEAKGVRIIPTLWPERLDPSAVESVFKTFGAERLVAKPLIGANADDTFVLDQQDPASWVPATAVFADQKAMVQPFMDSIQTQGEYSLFYFGGRYSHAIVKRPAQGDFRVQEEHGGIICPITPARDLLQAGSQAMAAFETTLLYARVDFVRSESGRPLLMEMELIEPSLYFDQCPDSVDLFARTFDAMAR